MKKIPPSANELRLLALIALREGEISEERCCEIIGCRRTEVRDEMFKRTGMYSPLREMTEKADSLLAALEEARTLVRAALTENAEGA